MSVDSTVNQWSRMLGVSLRPWTGHSPLSMILRGAIQLAVCIFFLVLANRARTAAVEELDIAYASMQNILILAIISLVLLGAMAAVKIVLGILDFVPRRTIEGTVVSLRERQFGDILPPPLERLVFERKGHGTDRRRWRTEVVVNTSTGLRQWTLRDARKRKTLRIGHEVRLTVSPILGYVARAESRFSGG